MAFAQPGGHNGFLMMMMMITYLCFKLAHRIVDMSSFPGMHDMSYLYPLLICFLFLNLQHVQNGFVFLVF